MRIGSMSATALSIDALTSSDAGPRARLVHAGGDVADERDDVGGLALERQRAGIRQRQRPQILDQPRQHMRFLEQLRELPIVARIDAVEQTFEAALQDRQRRAQLVRDVGHQVAPQAVGVLQPLGHRVERACARARIGGGPCSPTRTV